MKVFTEAELIKAAAKRAGVPQAAAKAVVRDFLRLVEQELRARHDVRLAVGTFRVAERSRGFGGHRIVFRPAGAIRKALLPKQPTPAAKALAERLRAAKSA